VGESERGQPHRERGGHREQDERDRGRRAVVDRADEQDGRARRSTDSVDEPDAERRERRAPERLRVGVAVLVPVPAALVHVRVRVHDVAMAMRVHVEVAPAPAEQQPDGEPDDQQPDGDLRRLLHAIGQRVAPEHEREAEREQRDRVARAPGEAERRRPARAAGPVAEDQRRDRGEVVGIRRVAHAEQQRDEDRDEEPASSAGVGDPLVEPEHGYCAILAAATAAWPNAMPPSLAGSRRGTRTRSPAASSRAVVRSSSTRFWNTPPERMTVSSPRLSRGCSCRGSW
jgi:hypothetical protein